MNLRLFHRIAALFRRDRLDHDLADEMSIHLDLAIEENLRNGLSPQQARRQALIQFRRHPTSQRDSPRSSALFHSSKPLSTTLASLFAFSKNLPLLPSSRFSLSPSASAPPPPSFPSSTASCSARSLTIILSKLSGSGNKTPSAAA